MKELGKAAKEERPKLGMIINSLKEWAADYFAKKETEINANYEGGILTISFPKEETPRKDGQNIVIK